MQGKLTVLGSGTSTGLPLIGCDCAVCTSSDPRDRRWRPSIWLEFNQHSVVVDTGPDLRAQALRFGIKRLDAVLFTHGHADHIMGLDDVRPFNFGRTHSLPLYAAPEVSADLRRIFRYAFEGGDMGSSAPRLATHDISGGFDLFGARFEPLPVWHGRTPVLGYRFGRNAYVTDFSEIPPASLERLRGLDLLILDALRRTPHPTHSNLENSLRIVRELRPARTYFTHLAHEMQHSVLETELPPGVALAWDGLTLDIVMQPADAVVPVSVMRLATELEAAGAAPSVVAVGNFDGVHLGHAALLRGVCGEAHARGLRAVAVTFSPHPLRILNPVAAPPLITPVRVRRRLIAALEPDLLLELPFSRDLSLLSPAEFTRQVLVEGLGARSVHEGADFRFGHRQTGDGAELSRLGLEQGFDVRLYGAVRARGEVISSSRIRQWVGAGEVARARSQLGRPFTIAARIARGRGIGRQRTVPTLNLEHYEELLPAAGVYLTRTRLGGEPYDSLTNVGVRPTFGPGALTVETFLLRPPAGGIDPQIGEEMEISFLRWLRAEARFASVEELKAAIGADVSFAQRFFVRLGAVSSTRPRSAPTDPLPG